MLDIQSKMTVQARNQEIMIHGGKKSVNQNQPISNTKVRIMRQGH